MVPAGDGTGWLWAELRPAEGSMVGRGKVQQVAEGDSDHEKRGERCSQDGRRRGRVADRKGLEECFTQGDKKRREAEGGQGVGEKRLEGTG